MHIIKSKILSCQPGEYTVEAKHKLAAFCGIVVFRYNPFEHDINRYFQLLAFCTEGKEVSNYPRCHFVLQVSSGLVHERNIGANF